MKARNSRKILTFTLLGAILLSNAGCGSTPGTESDTQNGTNTDGTSGAETTEEVITSDLPERNFNNAKFTILQRYVSEGHTHNFFEYDAEEQNGEILNDAVFNRNRRIEDRFNVEITTENAEFAASKVYTQVMADDCYYNLVADRPTEMTKFTLTGIFTTTDKLTYLDLSKPWWSSQANESFSIGGKLCVFTGDYVLYEKQRLPVELVNLDLAEDYNLPDLYDLVRDGKWTIDVLNQYAGLASSDLNGDGKISDFNEDQFGIVEGSYTYIPFVLFSMGNRFSEKQSDGSYGITLTSQHMLDSIGKLTSVILTDDTAWGEVVSNNWQNGLVPRTIFEEGRALFFNEVLSTIRNLKGDVRYGILPMPKYDENQEKYLTTVQYDNSGAIAVPITLSDEDMEMTSILLEALCEDSHTSTLPAFIEGVMKSKKAPDEESAEMLKMIFNTDNIVYDMFAAYNIGNLNNVVSLELYENRGTTYVSKMDSLKESIMAAYDEAVATFENLE